MDLRDIKQITLEELIETGSFVCECGKVHSVGTKKVVIESGAVRQLPGLIAECGGKKPFLLSGHDTFGSAGELVCQVLEDAGIPCEKYVFPQSPVPPTEKSVGRAVMHFQPDCDVIIGIGSGVINDIGKLLAYITRLPYIIVATAPSMDGYASASASMEMDGLKVSLDSAYAWAIVGDLDILCQAPMPMLQAGIGDMLAKYISLCEWKIAELVVGEYYCPVVAALVEQALKRCVASGAALVCREPEAVKAVMEGLVIAGMAMQYAGLSRPASGMEHYFSHIWDMRSLAFGTKANLHGNQCGVATLLSLKIYEYIRTLHPDRERALAYADRFSLEDWNRSLAEFIGEGAEAMIQAEANDGKYDPKKNKARLDHILARWEDIAAVAEALPRYEEVYQFMVSIGSPVSAEELGVTQEQVRTTFTMTKDVRDKYIGSRLLWDLGELETAKAVL